MHASMHTPESAPGHLRLVSSIHLAYVVALDVAHIVHRHVAGKGHSEVVAQRQQLSTCAHASRTHAADCVCVWGGGVREITVRRQHFRALLHGHQSSPCMWAARSGTDSTEPRMLACAAHLA